LANVLELRYNKDIV